MCCSGVGDISGVKWSNNSTRRFFKDTLLFDSNSKTTHTNFLLTFSMRSMDVLYVEPKNGLKKHP